MKNRVQVGEPTPVLMSARTTLCEVEVEADVVDAALWIGGEVVLDALDVFGSECLAKFFPCLTSSGQTPPIPRNVGGSEGRRSGEGRCAVSTAAEGILQ